MSLDELDLEDAAEENRCVSVRRPLFYILVGTLLVLLLLVGAGGIIGYSTITSPKAFCGYVVSYHIGDDDAQDGCYYKLAKEYHDIMYCNSILNPELQKECAKVVS